MDQSGALKILVISDYRGRQVHTMRPEAEILVGLAQRGCQVTVMTHPESTYIPRFKEGGIAIIPFHPKSKFNRKEIQFVRSELTEGKYDILYLINNNKAISTGIFAAMGTPVKVAVYRGYDGNLPWYNPISYIKHLSGRVDMIVCNSKGVEEYFHKQLFFDKNKTVVIPKGHSLEWYSDITPADLAAYGIDPNGFIVTWVGNNRQRMKGLPDLLQATFLWPREANMHLLLVGANTKLPENQALAVKSPNRDRIHFLGSIPDPRGIIAAGHVSVLPSVKGEASNRFILESMCLGKAPVVTDIPGNNALIIDGESGILVPPHDPQALGKAILNLRDNPELLRKYATAARERIREVFSHEKTVDATLAAFDQLVHPKIA